MSKGLEKLILTLDDMDVKVHIFYRVGSVLIPLNIDIRK